jgi:hypothetical protein
VKAYLPGIVIIVVGIVLFWCSTRKSLSDRARMFLEGQASVTVPAGLAALGIGAWKGKNGNGGGGRIAGGGDDPRGTPV